MMLDTRLKTRQSSLGVLRLTLAAPKDHNPITQDIALRLAELFEDAAKNKEVRVILLDHEGPTFCSGLAQPWIEAMRDTPYAESLLDGELLNRLFLSINYCPKPVVLKLAGKVYGAGVGLVAVADVVVASKDVQFSMGEVRMGLAPGPAAPFILGKIGPSWARRLFLTGEIVTAGHAREIGLVQDVLPGQVELDEHVKRLTQALLKGGAEAQRMAKALIHEKNPYLEASFLEFAQQVNAHRRVSLEGREGITAYLEKRPASWMGAQE